MNCENARRHWNLYHDSEGDAESHFQISEHLESCPKCAQWFAEQGRLEDLLREKLSARPATPELWAAVLADCGLRSRFRVRRRLVWTGLACAAALLVAGWYGSRASAPDLAELSVAWHERLARGAEPVQFRSQSDLEVEGYLRQRVSFPVRCPPRKDAGFEVSGAGIGTLGGESTAYLSGRVGEASVSIFILPRDSLSAFPHQQAAVRAQPLHRCTQGHYQMVLGIIDQNLVLVVGQTQSDRLLEVLSAYGTYPDHHQG